MKNSPNTSRLIYFSLLPYVSTASHHHGKACLFTVLFFFTAPKSGIMEMIARCTGLLSRLQTCIEFNLGFISYERRVFHFDMIDVIPKLFPPSRPEILHEIADKVR